VSEQPSPARLCFGCGSENPRGLGLRFRREDGRAVAEFTPPAHLQGYPGVVHGGGVVTMLDEAMGWAAYWQGLWAMTARLTTRFRRPVPLEEPLTVSGWVVRDRGRILTLRAELRSRAGRLLAEAEGTFVRVSDRQAEEMRRFYEATGRQTETMTSASEGRP
jgi:acyl-coenzyme A thioesterase PaaI-like protein